MNEKTVKQLAEDVRTLFKELDEDVIRLEMSDRNIEIEYFDSDDQISEIHTTLPKNLNKPENPGWTREV